MANNTNSVRQTHVSPGIYTKEVELQYAAKSLGITSLGLAGETVKGPAFQPILIENWKQFMTYFGGTNTEKFRASQYPKYELPYIAQEYLKQSQQLQVCRVLGLSGVNAGPAWVITAHSKKTNATYNADKPLVIAVLRSRGEYKKAAFLQSANPSEGICEDQYEYDKILYYAKSVKMVKSKSLTLGDVCSPGFSTTSNELTIDVNNYGTFTLEVTLYDNTVKKYSVTLNPGDKNYITNVLGTNPEIGDSEIFVEELYDIALQQLIEEGELSTLGEEGELKYFPIVHIVPGHSYVDDLLTMDESTLTRKDVGKRFLYSQSESVNSEDTSKGLKVHVTTDNGMTWTAAYGIPGHIYTVISYTTSEGTRKYYYGEYLTGNVTVSDDGKYTVADANISTAKNKETDFLKKLTDTVITNNIFSEAVEVMADGMYYVLNGDDVAPITLDLNNYKEQYRYASTPWIVSELKGSAEHVELVKLFRFHTISDGNSANDEVKISIENIDPDNGTFDVSVRSLQDTDASPVIIERYKRCDLIPGSSNYIALKIGSFDEAYESKSNYITVEVNECDKTMSSVPAGFLGYPVRWWDGLGLMIGTSNKAAVLDKKLQAPYFRYNTNVDEDIRISKQYFGISDITGIDSDILKYKGVEAYDGIPEGLSPCFHLDSRIVEGKPEKDATDGHYYVTNEYFKDAGDSKMKQCVSVDGIEGYEWVTVGRGNTTMFGIEPRIGSEDVMANTIYEDKSYRKFTVAFYGGFDGWDYYRTYRSNTDDFKYQKYRGNVNKISGEGTSVSIIKDPETYGFKNGEKVLNSDYYAYLSAVRQFANPSIVDINVLATPGIDSFNNTLLVHDVIEMVEEERADSIYVMTTADKPFGAGDSAAEMYSPLDVVYNLEETDIDSNYSCTYYPWVKTFDSYNNQYIYLPPTKDVVRNFAYTDNVAYPWFVAAGLNRGDMNAVRPRKPLKIDEKDTLYDGRINYVENFTQEGMKVWGDKNLQVNESQMNRISKRRLLLRIRKLLSVACLGLIFEPNDDTTVQSFRSAVSPILDDLMQKRALVDWRLEIDDSQEARDRLELNANIYLKLTPNLEYINLTFTITPNGTNWDNI